jgi:hypothetical protein
VTEASHLGKLWVITVRQRECRARKQPDPA